MIMLPLANKCFLCADCGYVDERTLLLLFAVLTDCIYQIVFLLLLLALHTDYVLMP